MLEIKGIGVVLGGRSIVNGVNLSVASGELLGLLGPNGAGKSTLLRSIVQLVPVSRGEVTLAGRPLRSITAQERARKISYLAQQGPVHWPLSVERLIALGRFPHLSSWQHLTRKDQAIVDHILTETDLVQFRRRTVATLSGGERNRALLARALAVGADLLLADEPVAALDPAHQLQIMHLLRQYTESGNSVIVVMHDLSLAARYCHRLALMHEGSLVASGPAREVLRPEHLAAVYDIEAHYGPDDDYYIVPWRRKSVQTPG